MSNERRKEGGLFQNRWLHAIGRNKVRRVLHARRQTRADDRRPRFLGGGELMIQVEQKRQHIGFRLHAVGRAHRLIERVLRIAQRVLAGQIEEIVKIEFTVLPQTGANS